jgi:DivIVA domain-containing protein
VENFDIQRIRAAQFREERRGYDRREVDTFMRGLADWLEGGGVDEAGSLAVKQKLERAGETTARILATAEEEAHRMRQEAAEEAEQTIAAAEAQARATVDAANGKGARIVEEGERRRQAIETVIGDLVTRRDQVLDQIERLGDKLDDAIEAHAPPEGGPDPFATPAELDPAERAAEIAEPEPAEPQPQVGS